MNNAGRSLVGSNCVITGATSGIGRAVSRIFAEAGANVLLIGRRASIGQELASGLGKKPGAGKLEFLRADLSDQTQVRALASDIKQRYDRIDVLINNAGARFNSFQNSVDNIELTFATNHLSHFLLTCLLLGPLHRAKAARVVTIGSGAHASVGQLDEWVSHRENYDRKLTYAKSKLANIVFAYELARRFDQAPFVSNAVDPGGVATNLGRNNGVLSWFRHLLYYALKGALLSPRHAAQSIVYLATDPSVAGTSGKYFFEKHEIKSSAISYDRSLADDLWLLSSKLTRLE